MDYDEHLENGTVLTFESANKIYSEILAGRRNKEAKFCELFDDMMKRANDYSII